MKEMTNGAHADRAAKLRWGKQRKILSQIYKSLSRLYKNPTITSGGYAATDTDGPLREQLEKLYDTFYPMREVVKQNDDALYCKVISLVFEVEDYLGKPSRVEKLVLDEYESIREIIKSKGVTEAETEEQSDRSLWKARIRCGIAALEIWRHQKRPDIVSEEFNNLDEFCRKSGLHREGMPAWTTLSLISVNYAKVAREEHDYVLAKEKFNEGTNSLYYRLCEILEEIATVREQLKDSPKEALELKEELDDLEDDLVFIKQKQTLATLFNLGFTSIQRGHLKRALHSCTAARLEFKLHGRHFHQLLNELLLLSIERASTSSSQRKQFLTLEKKLLPIVSKFRPGRDGTGHPKFYVYGLYELAIVQYYCNEMTNVERTLRLIEGLVGKNYKWMSRTALIRSHLKRQQWKEKKQIKLLNESLHWAEQAIDFAQKGRAEENEADAWLGKAIVYINQRELREARESAEKALDLLRIVDNPKLRALSYLVITRVCLLAHDRKQAADWLGKVDQLKPQVDYSYVLDKYAELRGELREIHEGFTIKAGQSKYNYDAEKENLLGWMILQVYDAGTTISDIARSLDLMDDTKDRRHIVRQFIEGHMRDDKYKLLSELLRKPKNKKSR